MHTSVFIVLRLPIFPTSLGANLPFIVTNNPSTNVPRSDKVGEDLPLKSMFNWKLSACFLCQEVT